MAGAKTQLEIRQAISKNSKAINEIKKLHIEPEVKAAMISEKESKKRTLNRELNQDLQRGKCCKISGNKKMKMDYQDNAKPKKKPMSTPRKKIVLN